MKISRREFSRIGIAAAAAAASGLPVKSWAQNKAKDSTINGVQIGLQPFCYHDLPNNIENRPILIERMIQNGLSSVELHMTWVEPRFAIPGVNPEEARQKQRAWRLAARPDYYRKAKQEFDDAGIKIFSVYLNFNETFTGPEIDACFEAAKALGAGSVIGSFGQAVSKSLAPYPGKHGMFLGLHNHDNVSDPDSYSDEKSFINGFAQSPDFKATLDVRHFVAGNGDCLGFLERHHERVAAVHLGDRRRNNGHSTPFGEGDAPIIELLRQIRDNKWPIVALLEFEHGTLRNGVDEVQIAFDYCKRALA